MAEIRIDLQNVRRQMLLLERAANQAKREANRLSSAEKGLRGTWEGNASEAYRAKLREQSEALYALARQIEAVSMTIGQTARRLAEQEEALRKAAQNI